MVTGGHFGAGDEGQLTWVIDIVDPTRTCNNLQRFPVHEYYGGGKGTLSYQYFY